MAPGEKQASTVSCAAVTPLEDAQAQRTQVLQQEPRPCLLAGRAVAAGDAHPVPAREAKSPIVSSPHAHPQLWSPGGHDEKNQIL